jgi:hypothetical protein
MYNFISTNIIVSNDTKTKHFTNLKLFITL